MNELVIKALMHCKIAFIVALTAIFVAGGCDGDAAEAVEEPDQPVEVESVMGQTFERRLRGIGTLMSVQAVEITAEAEGKVSEILFRQGQPVEAGQLLARIDDSRLQRQLASGRASLQGARSELDYAQRSFERFRQLWEDDAVSIEDFERREAEFLSAQSQVQRLEAEVELIEERLEDTQVRAPFAGLLSARMVDIGQLISPGVPIVGLFSREIEIDFMLPERHIGQVEYGQSVEIVVDAYPEEIFHAQVTFISPNIDESTRNFTVRAQLDEQQRLRPGGFAHASVIVDMLEDVPAVPEQALTATRIGYVVFVVEDDTVQRRQVSVGLRRPGIAQIAEGLEIGELVVVAGHAELADGDRVTVRNRDNDNGGNGR